MNGQHHNKPTTTSNKYLYYITFVIIIVWFILSFSSVFILDFHSNVNIHSFHPLHNTHTINHHGAIVQPYPTKKQHKLLVMNGNKFKPKRTKSSDEIPLKMRYISSNDSKMLRRSLNHTPKQSSLFPSIDRLVPLSYDSSKDYNGLILFEVEEFEFGRHLRQDVQDFQGQVWVDNKEYTKGSAKFDKYYAFDDDEVRATPLESSTCRRTSWHRLYNPNCNTFHEFDLVHDESHLWGGGFYRSVFKALSDVGETIAFKGSKWDHKYNDEIFEFTRMDALVMERLTSSPRIVNMYGHCAAAVVTEILAYDVQDTIVIGSGHPKEPLNDKLDVDSRNDYTPIEKLETALEMARCIAELHGFKDGVIVHDDIQLSQFLIGHDGKMKLNDFNRAEVMLYDSQNNEYCRYRNGYVYGNYRAPEEMEDGPLNENIDVYSFGNNIYCLLTGMWNFYDTEDDKEVQKKTLAGERPQIDERYRTRTSAEGSLVKVMERCWEKDPDKRINIFEAVRLLEDALENEISGKKIEQI